jgi:deazaflavin-dependent oxidoreductase (nitroreductase family)
MRLPGFGEIVHVGRRSGRTYRTPVLTFRRAETIVIALTYGPETEWVQNVLRSGGCTFETRTGHLVLSEPRLRRDAARRLVPPPIRLVLAALGSTDFLHLTVAEDRRNRPDT